MAASPRTFCPSVRPPGVPASVSASREQSLLSGWLCLVWENAGCPRGARRPCPLRRQHRQDGAPGGLGGRRVAVCDLKDIRGQ